MGAEVNTINEPTTLLEVTIGEKELPSQLQYRGVSGMIQKGSFPIGTLLWKHLGEKPGKSQGLRGTVKEVDCHKSHLS